MLEFGLNFKQFSFGYFLIPIVKCLELRFVVQCLFASNKTLFMSVQNLCQLFFEFLYLRSCFGTKKSASRFTFSKLVRGIISLLYSVLPDSPLRYNVFRFCRSVLLDESHPGLKQRYWSLKL